MFSMHTVNIVFAICLRAEALQVVLNLPVPKLILASAHAYPTGYQCLVLYSVLEYSGFVLRVYALLLSCTVLLATVVSS